MLVGMAPIVVGMEHAQVPRELVRGGVQFAAQVRMTGVETHPNVRSFDLPQDPKHVGGVSKEEMRQFVFQDAVQPMARAAFGDALQGLDHQFEPAHPLLPAENGLVFRSWMNDEIPTPEIGGRFHGGQHLLDRIPPTVFLERGDVDSIGERRVKGIRAQAAHLDFTGRALDRGRIPEVQMLG